MYAHLDRGDHSENEFSPSNNWCKTLELKNEGELFVETRLFEKVLMEWFDPAYEARLVNDIQKNGIKTFYTFLDIYRQAFAL